MTFPQAQKATKEKTCPGNIALQIQKKNIGVFPKGPKCITLVWVVFVNGRVISRFNPCVCVSCRLGFPCVCVLLSVPCVCVCLFPICVRLIGERVRGGLAGPGARWGVAEREDTPGGVGAAPSPPSVQKALKNDDLIKMPSVRVIKRKPLNN